MYCNTIPTCNILFQQPFVAILLVVLQYNSPSSPSSHNTQRCIAIQISVFCTPLYCNTIQPTKPPIAIQFLQQPTLALLSQYNPLYGNTISSNQLPQVAIQIHCLAIQFPSYSSSSLAIQNPRLQYKKKKKKFLTIQLAVAQIRSAPLFEQIFFFILFFFFFFKLLENHPKTYTHIFFFFHFATGLENTKKKFISIFFSFLPATGRYTKNIPILFFSLFCYWTTKKKILIHIFFFPHSPVPQ